MAININFNGLTIRKPGSYSRTSVNLTGGFPIAATGLVGIIGEADTGIPGSADDIRSNFYSPEQFTEVIEKYKSGAIVDAFRLLIQPSNDDRIVNGAQRIFIYKTNESLQASGSLPTAYGTVDSRNYGFDQNTISFQVEEAQAEVGPAFASFNFIPDENTASALGMRINGGALLSQAIAAAKLPDGFVSDFVAAFGGSGMTATGGTDRQIFTGVGGQTLEILFTDGLVATINIAAGTLDNVPSVGDTLYIPAGSAIDGGAGENVGGYLITAASATQITALKLADPLQAGDDVSPAVALGAITDLQAFAPIDISYTGTTPDGVGAAIEMFSGSGAAVLLEELLYGGSDKGILNATLVADGSTLAIAIPSAGKIELTIDSSFAAIPAVGDILTIKPGSILKGAANANVGNYLITAATALKIEATKFSGTPVAVSATDIAAISDAEVFKGITSNSAAPLTTFSGSEPKVTIAVDRQSDDKSEDSVSLGGNIVLKIGYDGTTADCTINAINLVTSIGGGSGSALTIKLADYDTIQALVDYIDAQTGYTAEVGSNVYAQLAPSVLDRVSAIDICAEYDGAMPGRIKKDSKDIQDFFDASELVSLDRALYVGLPDIMASATFLTGGAKGGTSAASASSGIDEMQKVRVNSIVPLFSRDATADILDELTEPSSTYQIAAINAAAKSHTLLMSNTQKRSERNAYCSFKGTFNDTITEANSLASSRVQLALQDAKILKIDGTLDWVNPWGIAAICAGMQAGAPVGEPMTFKYINVSGIRHSDFDPATEYDSAIENGLLFAEQPDDGGFRIVVGNTTYAQDSSFVYNRISVMYAADTVAYNLRQQLERIFVGVNSAIADAESIKNTCVAILNTFLEAGIIKGDDTNDGKGYKNLIVRLEGNIAYVDVTITPAQGIDFIPISIVLDNIRESA